MQADLFRTAPSEPPVVAAYGAGVDSTAMIIGWLDRGRRLDLVLHADTGSEKPETVAYRDIFREWVEARGIRFEVCRYEPQRFKHWPPYRSLDENCFTNGTLPSISFARHSCSLKWKVEPQDRWMEGWEPAAATWAGGGRVRKLIGYDAGPRDRARYAHAVGQEDPRYLYEYPLQEWGWDREECGSVIVAAGLPLPVKSACFMCAAAKPWEIAALSVEQLRRIVLMEARAKPRLRNVDGLWRKPVQGRNGATPRPGDMTSFIRSEGLLPADEIDEIVALAPAALVRFQDAEGQVPLERRAELSAWLKLFDARDRGIFGTGAARLYDSTAAAA